MNKYCNDKVYGILFEPLEDSEFIGPSKYRTGLDPNSIWGLETAFNDLRASIHQAESVLSKLKSILKNPVPPAEKLKPQERKPIEGIIVQLKDIENYITEYNEQKFNAKKEFQNERKQLLDKALHFTNKHLEKYTNLLAFYDDLTEGN